MTQQEEMRWKTARAMKKDFAKVIKAIRTQDGGNLKIKPMMTEAQMEKGTATVNLGGEWTNYENSSNRADIVMNDERFQNFLIKWNAKAARELVTRFNVWQIRISY